jgi:hypothetical protein
MAKRKGKSVSFDAMVKFFMHAYEIPTKRDIDRLNERLDRIERLLLAAGQSRPRRASTDKTTAGLNSVSAAETVLTVVQRHPDGIGLTEIQQQTGFSDKKLRNTIFRLHKLGRLARKRRGIYAPAGSDPVA